MLCFESRFRMDSARILSRTTKYEHITSVLRSLHWLSVTFRTGFKVLLLVYIPFNGQGPQYIADMLLTE